MRSGRYYLFFDDELTLLQCLGKVTVKGLRDILRLVDTRDNLALTDTRDTLTLIDTRDLLQIAD